MRDLSPLWEIFNWASPEQDGRRFADGIFIGLDNGVAPHRRQAIIWTNSDTVHWRIYATLEGDELIMCMRYY